MRPPALARPLALLGATLIAAVIFQTITTNSTTGFLSLANLANLAGQASVVVLIAAGATLLLNARRVDLSAGGILGFSATALALLQSGAGWPWWLSVPAALAIGTALGAINGALVGRLGLPSVLVTLAALVVYRNAAPALASGRTIVLSDGTFQALGSNGVPVLIAAVVLGAVAWGARDRLKHPSVLFALAGTLAALAAVIQAARVTAVTGTTGRDLEITAITAAVLGGATLGGKAPQGAQGSILGATLAALLVASVQNGLALAGVGAEWQGMVLGVALVLGLVVNATFERKPR